MGDSQGERGLCCGYRAHEWVISALIRSVPLVRPSCLVTLR